MEGGAVAAPAGPAAAAPAPSLALAGSKRPLSDVIAAADGDDGPSNLPCADVQPALQPSDVHVLVADDEKISRMVISKLLRQCGYQVTTVDSGRSLLLKLAETPGAFSLVLTDVAMPDVNGLAVLRYVRSQPALHHVPVIMMSAHENAGTVFECIQRGAEDYLLKPVTPKEMKQLWQHVWRRRCAWQRVPHLAAAPAVAAADAGPLPAAAAAAAAAAEGSDGGAAAAAAAAAAAEAADPASSAGGPGTELYTASEMREHCQRQIARYSKVIQVIDAHPHLFPSEVAAAGKGA